MARRRHARRKVDRICILHALYMHEHDQITSKKVWGRTYRLFTRAEPHDMRRVGYVGATAKYRENTAEALRARLSGPKNIEVDMPWGTEVRCAVHVKLEVEGAAYRRHASRISRAKRAE